MWGWTPRQKCISQNPSTRIMLGLRNPGVKDDGDQKTFCLRSLFFSVHLHLFFLLGLAQLSLSFRTYGGLILATPRLASQLKTEKWKHMASVCSGSRFPRQGPLGLCWEVAVFHYHTATMWAASSESFPTVSRENSKEHTLAINPYLKIV